MSETENEARCLDPASAGGTDSSRLKREFPVARLELRRSSRRSAGFVPAVALIPTLVAVPAAAATLRVPEDHRTVQQAADRATEGDVILLGPGEFEGPVTLKSGVTLRGAGLDATRLWSTGGITVEVGDTPGVVRNARGVLIEDLQMESRQFPGQMDSAQGIDFLRASSNWMESRQFPGQLDSSVVLVSLGPGLTLRRCRVNGGGGCGVRAHGNVVIVDSVVELNKQCGVDMNGGRLERSRVEKNDGGGVYVSCWRCKPDIYDNVIAQNGGPGVLFNYAAGGRFERNLVLANRSHGVEVYDRDTAPSLRHNVVFGNEGAGLWVYNGATPVVRDNIIVGNGEWGILASREGTRLLTVGPGRPIASHNLVWNNQPENFRHFRPDSTFVVADPKFLDPAVGDFRLAADSPARGRGWDAGNLGFNPSRGTLPPRDERAGLSPPKAGAGAVPGEAPIAAPRGRSVAVVIGVQNYRDSNIRDLRFSHRDAAAVADLLRRAGYEVRLLTDHTAPAATLEEFRKALLWLSEAGPQDHALFYFSGHGSDAPNPLGEDRGFLLPVDSQQAHLPATALPLAELRRAVDRSASRRFTVLLDTCFAAGAKSVSRPRPGGKESEITSGLTFGSGKVALYSSRDNEPSLECERYQHGCFTYHVLAAWKAGRRAAEEVYLYLYERVAADTRGEQHPRKEYREAEGVVPLF